MNALLTRYLSTLLQKKPEEKVEEKKEAEKVILFMQNYWKFGRFIF